MLAQQPDRQGIIPARAGFTPPGRRPRPQQRDHPRSRGVYAARASFASRRAGSSPLARGLPPTWSTTATASGIIPARAGFTYGPGNEPGPSWDHPRSRGVYKGHQGHGVVRTGSSPLARGLRDQLVHCDRQCRIIPARAGFTYRGEQGYWHPQDHPRSRGVYQKAGEGHQFPAGSSPLARGLQM